MKARRYRVQVRRWQVSVWRRTPGQYHEPLVFRFGWRR